MPKQSMGADNVAYDDEPGDCGGGSVTVVAQAPPDVMPIFVSLPSLLSDTQQPAPTAPPPAVREAGAGVPPPKSGPQKNNGVYLACASVNTGVAWEDFISNLLGLQHCWIQTPQKKAGLGPAKPGPLPNCPLGIPTAITDQSDHKANSLTPLPNVNAACVNAQLQIGTSQGPWLPWHNCNSIADGVIASCSTNVWWPSWSSYSYLH